MRSLQNDDLCRLETYTEDIIYRWNYKRNDVEIIIEGLKEHCPNCKCKLAIDELGFICDDTHECPNCNSLFVIYNEIESIASIM